MLDTAIKQQLSAYLERLQRPIEIVATLDASAKAQEMGELVQEIAALSDRIGVRVDGNARLVPSFAIGRPGEAARIEFAGIPMPSCCFGFPR